MSNKQAIKDLQEITFWQQLNKQLHEKKAQGLSTRNIQHENLKEFCFNNDLFLKIKQPQYIQDISLVLCSNLTDIFFLTLNTPSWINNVIKLIPRPRAALNFPVVWTGLTKSPSIVPKILSSIDYISKLIKSSASDLIILNIDQALADAYVELRKKDRKYNLTEKTDVTSDDDEELYAFINEYTEKRQEIGFNFSEVVNRLFEAKGIFLMYLINEVDYKSSLKVENNKVAINIDSHKKKDEIVGNYTKIFYKKAEDILNNAKNIVENGEIERLNMTYEKDADSRKNTSVKEFMNYETALYKKEKILLNKFNDNFGTSKADTHIFLVNISPFSFLEYPFPEV